MSSESNGTSPSHNGTNRRKQLTLDDDGESLDTISRDNPISEFLRQNQSGLKSLTEEEFSSKFQAHMSGIHQARGTIEASSGVSIASAPASIRSPGQAPGSGMYLRNIVLKFTTLSENCSETPSFFIGPQGAKIGQDECNEVCVPTDTRLAPVAHTYIDYSDGEFYIIDGGYDFSASIRIGVGGHQEKWIMSVDAKFSAGNSVFRSCGLDANGDLLVEICEGPLKGTIKTVGKQGANVGRSSDNTISVPDRELSRKHSRVEYDTALEQFVVLDLGSTNGTYMQLVGPYNGRYKLNLNDHILVGRTGFSINRFDYGLSEEMGHRTTMEDACSIVQHLCIDPLNTRVFSPQSFFGVYDGHGGNLASTFLSQNLHDNVATGLVGLADELLRLAGQDRLDSESVFPILESGVQSEIDALIIKSMKASFLQTDADFLSKSTHPQHGSTGSTALVLGRRIYCANVGDSRTMLCRNFSPLPLSEDHKPAREDEAQRIRDAGGFVINNRVMGELAVSRAFGDSEFKKGIKSMIEEVGDGDGDDGNWDQPLIIAEPDIQVVSLTEADQFLLLACDGLFDVFSCEDVVTFVKSNMEEHRDAQKCCQNLTYEAIRKRNSRDNVSVILIILNKWY